MRIGLDIDNVITAFDDLVFKEILKEDKNKRNAGIINEKARNYNHGMFDWSQEELDEFYEKNMERIAKDLKMRNNSKKIIDKLLSEGDEIYLITHRVYPHYKYPYETTVEWLKKHDINYTKLVLSKLPDKTSECRDLKIDIMFDDRVSGCTKMAENGVNCYVMKTKYNVRDKHNLPVAKSWLHLYEIVSKYKSGQIGQ